MMMKSIVFLLCLSESANAFTATPHYSSSRLFGLSTSNTRTSTGRRIIKSPSITTAAPRYMVATAVASSNDDVFLTQIDKKKESLLKERAKAQERLSQSESRLQELELKRRAYLGGGSLGKVDEEQTFSETAVRSAVKAFCWRVIAGGVTFATSLRISGSLVTALSIVGSDFFSKAFTMFFGERIMNKSQAGRKGGSDAVGRSLAKAIIWRLFAICNTLTFAIFFAKDLSIASKIAGFDGIFKTALMFFYERVWAKIQWGKEYIIEFSI